MYKNKPNLWTVYSTIFSFFILLCYSSSSRKEITIDLMFSAAKLVSCWVLFLGFLGVFLLQARCRRQSPSSYLGCHCGSRGATFSQSSPVIGRDGCKAALLQNMSGAGEKEVGVESGKRATSKDIRPARSLTPTRSDIPAVRLEHRTCCQAATKQDE